MTEWYYGYQGERKGPVPETVLQHMLERGGLPDSTMVWSEGMADWVAASKVPQLQPPEPAPTEEPHSHDPPFETPFETPPFEPPQAEEHQRPGPTATAHVGIVVRPWARFWARILDLSLFQSFVILAFGLNPLSISGSIGALFMWCFVEAFCLSRWGATPGRWLMRTRVYTEQGMLLPYPVALRRAVTVILRGMALGLPVVSIIFMVLAFKELTDRGKTSWDREARSVVSHHPIGGGRILLAIAVLLVASQLVVIFAPEFADQVLGDRF